jgi:hypothetical protein
VIKLNAKIEEVKVRVSQIVRNREVLEELSSIRIGISDLSNTTFQLSPANESRILELCNCEAVSRWVVDRLLEVYETCEAGMAIKLYRNLSGLPWAATFRGCLFERQVLAFFDCMKTGRVMSIRGLSNSDQMMWTYRGHIPFFTFLQDEFAAVDSIVYDPNEVLTCIQITTNADHPVAVSGLERVQKWLKRSTPAENLRPHDTRPWRFIFVVPSETARIFKLQPLEGKTKDKWAGRVDQYVLGLQEETIFRRRSDWSKQHVITLEQGQQVRC